MGPIWRVSRSSLRIGLALLALAAAASSLATGVTLFGFDNAQLTDVREYAGSGYGNEYAHVVRVDYQFGGFPAVPPTHNADGSTTAHQVAYWFNPDKYYYFPLGPNGITSYGSPIQSDAQGFYPIGTGCHFEVRYAGQAGFVLQLQARSMDTTTYPDGHSTTTEVDTTQQSDLYLGRQNLDIVSVDSRTVYGQPNLDGEQPGDPNADLRNVNFLGWIYRGGLFAGNSPSGTRDQSGTARVQAWVPPQPNWIYLMSSVTLYPLGRPPAPFNVPSTYRLYAPATNDPNIAATSASVTWATAWNLANATSLSDPIDFTNLPSNEYVRFLMTIQPTKLILALDSEATKVAGSTFAWQYFSSAPYQAHFTTLPLKDSCPRVWSIVVILPLSNP